MSTFTCRLECSLCTPGACAVFFVDDDDGFSGLRHLARCTGGGSPFLAYHFHVHVFRRSHPIVRLRFVRRDLDASHLWILTKTCRLKNPRNLPSTTKTGTTTTTILWVSPMYFARAHLWYFFCHFRLNAVNSSNHNENSTTVGITITA